jgi:hypothetical protein
MFTQRDCKTWKELEEYALELQGSSSGGGEGSYSQLLFRGQASYGWDLETTLERSGPKLSALSEYYRLAAVAQTQIESFLPRSWPNLDYVALEKMLASYDSLRLAPLPHYEYLVYLRHHGFPSPLLDWTRSLYVAAFFAFDRPASERVAIYVYQEFAGHGKASSSDRSQIHTLGPNIRTHQRHFLQQAEYTTALRYEQTGWRLAKHSEVFLGGPPDQDHLWKLTAPSNEARTVLNQLETYNINAFSLFQSEDALLATLASRLIARSAYGRD